MLADEGSNDIRWSSFIAAKLIKLMGWILRLFVLRNDSEKYFYHFTNINEFSFTNSSIKICLAKDHNQALVMNTTFRNEESK